MEIPHHIHAEGIEPHGLDHLETVLPVLVGDAGVVDLGGEDLGREGFVLG